MKSISEVAIFQGFNDPPISISKLAQSFNLHKPISLLDLMRLCNARAKDNSMTQLLSSGPAGTKINIAVMGDGFAAGDDQILYNKAVKDLLIHGLFRHDFFQEQRSAFNVYRVNLISQDSGVGTKTYNNGDLISTVTRNTALGIFFNGSWLHNWMEDGTNTDTLINNALNQWVPDHTITMILINNPGFGGNGGGGRLTLSLGVTWDTIAHEFGHAMGGLGDEYCEEDKLYTGSEPSSANLTIDKNKASLKWKNFIVSTTPIPTGITPTPIGAERCAVYNQGTRPDDWNDDQSVGLFEGGGTVTRGIYRPVINCRMRNNSPPFCPICNAQMKSITGSHLGFNSEQNDSEQRKMSDLPQDNSVPPLKKEVTRKPEDNPTVSESSNGYVRLKIHMEEGKLSVTDVKEVSGPLIAKKTISPGYNYEVLTDDQPITLGFLPDVGVRRSFANIDVPGREGRHHITALSSFDFFVRVPKNKISEKTLPKMTITVQDVKQTPDRLLKDVSLTKQTDLVSTEIGRMDGIKLDEVPKTVSSQLKRIMKENVEPK